ncbi:uncharacterized protein Tco025E_09097 [Trypanosoma conorhini]|uniref:Uncharacterized protein n=1 Tax=Trypanosoma conorhini TaxID=83891 RepID=A0A3R7MAF4_9TRYP|nr:uncharacterized protein Tco025E_09097 [Trypanosoma conorhini]RNE99076.1 hypothetical protein Tco025E_09097 [Trypanosoma conorhini]
MSSESTTDTLPRAVPSPPPASLCTVPAASFASAAEAFRPGAGAPRVTDALPQNSQPRRSPRSQCRLPLTAPPSHRQLLRPRHAQSSSGHWRRMRRCEAPPPAPAPSRWSPPFPSPAERQPHWR